jgi:hypothetical protein
VTQSAIFSIGYICETQAQLVEALKCLRQSLVEQPLRQLEHIHNYAQVGSSFKSLNRVDKQTNKQVNTFCPGVPPCNRIT